MSDLDRFKDLADLENSLQDLAWSIAMFAGQFSLILVRCNYSGSRERIMQRLREICLVEIKEIFLDKSVTRLFFTIYKQIGNEQPSSVIVFGLELVSDINQALLSMNQVREEFRKNFHFPLVFWINDEILKKMIKLVPDFESWATTINFARKADKYTNSNKRIIGEVTLSESYQVLDTLNQSPLHRIFRAFSLGQGHFSLILVNCNYRFLQEQVLQQLQEQFLMKYRIQKIVLPQIAKDLDIAVRLQIDNELPQGLIILGLDSVEELDNLLRDIDHKRDEFRKHYLFPILLWVTDEVLQKLQRLASEFTSWAATPIQFDITFEELFQFLRQKNELMFMEILQFSAINKQQTHSKIIYTNSILKKLREDYSDLHYAAQKLLERGKNICVESDLEASLVFVFGLNNYGNERIDIALDFFRKSLKYWQKLCKNGRINLVLPVLNYSSDLEFVNRYTSSFLYTSSLLRQGVLLFYMGLCHYRLAERNLIQPHNDWRKAKKYFQQCIKIFESAGCLDLVAQFIVFLVEILEHLQAWTELQQASQKSLELHQIYGNHMQIACDYGFLAEVAVQESRWTQVCKFAQNGLQELYEAQEKGNSQERIFSGILAQIYHLFLAKALRYLGDKKNATEHLKSASLELKKSLETTEHHYDVCRYIHLLKKLRQFYFEEDSYLEALYIRQRLHSVEQMYGFSVFIGARPLQHRKEADPMQNSTWRANNTALEIAASGRERDINNLIGRISRADQKLTILHGQSGVGKSSTVNAGLVPALQNRMIGDQISVPVVLQVYTDWVRELGKSLSEASYYIKREIVIESEILPDTPITISGIFQQLQENADNHLITVLIFDQFEEFFFGSTDLHQKQEFDKFVSKCLNIPFVKVILSLREDYLHLLLEFKHLRALEAINNNILDKHIRYQLNNFSPEYAKAIIHKLTERSQFNLEPALIDILVEDLSTELGEVRPVELQLVGAQLEAEKITTLKQYRQGGSKEQLVKRFLVTLVKECGSDLEDVTWLLLYLLTDRRGTRRLRTRRELEAVSEFANLEPEKLELLLAILVQSGLVLLIPEVSEDRYQLVHDYLVTFIREKQESAGLVDIEVELKLTKGQLIQALREQEIAKIRALNSSSQALLLSHEQLGALLNAFEAGRQLQRTKASYEVTIETLCTLRQAVYGVRECNFFQGHSAGVSSICFSPKGQTLASASEDGTVILWQLDGHQLQTFQGHSSRVTNICFSPDGKTLVSADGEGTLVLWRLERTKLLEDTKLQSLRGHENKVTSIDFSVDGKTFVSSSDDGKVKLWCFNGSQLQLLKELDTLVYDFSFSRDNQTLICAGEYGHVTLQYLNSNESLSFKGHNNRVTSVYLSSDGETLVSASLDGSLTLWHFDGRKLQNPQTFNGHKDWVTKVSFSHDDQMIASASEDGTVKLWSLSGNELKTFKGHKNKVTSISFNPNGQTLASADSDGVIKIWRLKGNELQVFRGHRDKVTSVRFCADNDTLVSGSENGTVILWRSNGTEIRNLQHHSSRVTSLSFSPDGQTFASADEDGNVMFGNFNPNKLILPLIHTAGITSVAFSSDGQTLAFAGEDGSIELWSKDVANLQASYKYRGQVTSICFSSDNEVFTSATGDGLLQLWRFNGTKLQEIKTIHAHSKKVTSVCFSPDDSILASASEDCTVKLWSLSGNELAILRGHNQRVTSICFSPNGQLLASASEDCTIKLWSLLGKELQTFNEHIDCVTDICFSRDGQTLASASRDGTVILWNLNLQNLLMRASSWLDVYLKTHPNNIYIT